MSAVILWVLFGVVMATVAFVLTQPRFYLARHFNPMSAAEWERDREIDRRTIAIIRERGIPTNASTCVFCENSRPRTGSAEAIAEAEYIRDMKAASGVAS